VGSVLAPGGTPRHLTLLRWYYLGTPVFWLVGVLWGVNVRVAFLDAFPVGRTVYYVLCFLIGVVALRAPQYASRLALYESAANLGLIILSVGVWYLQMLEWAAGPSAVVRVVSPAELVNFVLTTTIGTISYTLRRLESAP
jgi:hypothetical protein